MANACALGPVNLEYDQRVSEFANAFAREMIQLLDSYKTKAESN